MIEITEEQVDRINLILGGIKNAPRNAMYNVMNRATGTVVSKSGKFIRETYRIRQKDITDSRNIKVRRAGRGNLEAEIVYAGSVIPLFKFEVNPKQPKRKRVSVAVLKESSGKRLVSAYIANLGHGMGVFERETSKRESSKQLFGPSTAHMMENIDVMDKVEAAAMKTINERVEHEISRILNGYTGSGTN